LLFFCHDFLYQIGANGASRVADPAGDDAGIATARAGLHVQAVEDMVPLGL
jgi:hypothetical protein